MATVLFLLCVPEEEGETEKAQNTIKKGDAKDAAETSNAAQSVADPSCKSGAVEIDYEVHGPGEIPEGQDKAEQDGKDSVPCQAVEKASPSEDLPQQTNPSPASGCAVTENKGRQSDADEKSALASHALQSELCEPDGDGDSQVTKPKQDSSHDNSETQKQMEDAQKEAVCEPEKEVTGTQKSGQLSSASLMSAHDGADGQCALDGEGWSSGGEPLINKKRMEEALTDNFWDFESPAPTDTASSTPNAENLVASKSSAEYSLETQQQQKKDQEQLDLERREKEQVQSHSDQNLKDEQLLQKKDLPRETQQLEEKDQNQLKQTEKEQVQSHSDQNLKDEQPQKKHLPQETQQQQKYQKLLEQTEKEQVQSHSDQNLEDEQQLEKEDLSKNSENASEKVELSPKTKETNIKRMTAAVSPVIQNQKLDDKDEEQSETTGVNESEYVTCPNTPENRNLIENKAHQVDKFTVEPVPDSKTVQPPVLADEASLAKGMGLPVVPAARKSPESSGASLLVPTPEAESKKRGSPGVQSLLDSNDEDTEMMEFLPKLSLRKQVRQCLLEFGIKNVSWQKCTGDRVWQVQFVEESGVRCEDIMLKLESIGLGHVKKSSISVLPISIHCEKDDSEEVEADEEDDNNKNEERLRQMQEKTSEFHKSIKSRLVVQQVVRSVESNAGFTFDYVMLIIIASMVAALGLAEDNSVILVASMLISPLMGPILAGTFGTVIKNVSLRNLGIRSELYGLGICLLCGFVFGLVPSSLEAGSFPWRSVDEWPTSEMSSRGVTRGLLVGMLIAIPSGVGVALSVLGGNTGSLVGVAISASLLPPAVNAGMLWSAALITAAKPPPLQMQAEMRNISEVINGTVTNRTDSILTPKLGGGGRGLVCPLIVDNTYVHTYFCDPATDFAVLGTISLLLTILNIICIFIMGIIVLKIKEVAPRTSTQWDKSFFQNDIKVARESYTTTKGPQSSLQGKKWLEEYKALKKMMDLRDTAEDNTMEFQQILQSVENSPEVRDVLGLMPRSPTPMSEEMAPVFYEAQITHIQKHPEVEPVYRSLGYNTIRRRAAHPNRRSAPLFPFPSSGISYSDLPASPMFLPPMHLPLAPIAEEDISGSENIGKAHSSRRHPRLRMPKAFHVMPLEEKYTKKMTGKKDMPAEHEALLGAAGASEIPEEKGTVDVVNEKSKGGRKLRFVRRSKTGKSAKSVAGASPMKSDEELRLLSIHPSEETSAPSSTKA